jgi:predicted porin
MKAYKKLNITGLILGLFLTVNTASAALLLEPHLGFNLGSSGDGDSYNGSQLGMRVGYQQLGLMAGLDFTRSTFDQDQTVNNVAVSNEMERNEWGLFVGYNFPIFIRAWAAYYFANTTKATTSNFEMSGNTTELGVGFTALPFLSVNVMYRMINLDELKASNGTKSTIDNSNKEFVVGVSLPLTL